MMRERFMGHIVQCHIDEGDPETFVVGSLVYQNEKWFLLKMISPQGRWDGLALFPQTDLQAVEEDTDYILKLKALLKYRKTPAPTVPPIGENPLVSLLDYAQKEQKVIQIELCASGACDVLGIVSQFDEATLCVRQIDEFGRYDGKAYLAMDAITRFFVDSDELKGYEALVSDLPEYRAV